jgi:hypothetical protein
MAYYNYLVVTNKDDFFDLFAYVGFVTSPNFVKKQVRNN